MARMITSATNLAKAREAVEAYLAKQPVVTDLQQMTVPLLANVLVLANRRSTSNRELREWLSGPRLHEIATEAATSKDEEQKVAATRILGWLAAETDDMYLAANHNVIRAEAMAMLARDGR